jgi:hypothetical protein
MPNRYEREIEEILRNIDRTEPKQGLGDRLRAFNNRPKTSRAPRRFNLPLDGTDLLLLLGVALALVAAGITCTSGENPTPITGGIALAAFVVIVCALGAQWMSRFRGPSMSKQWRGNVVDLPVRRRNPFSGIVTRFRIIRLRLRYRNRLREDDD